MLKKTLPIACGSLFTVAVLAYLAQSRSLAQGINLYPLEALCLYLLIGLVLSAAVRQTLEQPVSRRALILVIYCPITVSVYLLSLLAGALVSWNVYPIPAFPQWLLHQCLLQTLLVCGTWLVLGLFGKLLWKLPPRRWSTGVLPALIAVIMLGSLLHSICGYASIGRMQTMYDLNATGATAGIAMLYAVQQSATLLTFYITGLLWSRQKPEW